jgi:hypothetical protein
MKFTRGLHGVEGKQVSGKWWQYAIVALSNYTSDQYRGNTTTLVTDN